MNIQLNQTEIVQAIRLYISHQGISLHGQELDVTFTAGRKEGGLTAALSIEVKDVGNSPSLRDLPVITFTSGPADSNENPNSQVQEAEEAGIDTNITHIAKTTLGDTLKAVGAELGDAPVKSLEPEAKEEVAAADEVTTAKQAIAQALTKAAESKVVPTADKAEAEVQAETQAEAEAVKVPEATEAPKKKTTSLFGS